MFSPEYSFDSITAPGARVTVKRMGYARRVEIERQTLALRQRMQELSVEYPPLNDCEADLSEQLSIARRKVTALQDRPEYAAALKEATKLVNELHAAAGADVRKARKRLDEEQAILEAEARIPWIRAGFVSIAGSEFDGMSVDELLNFGPVELTLEIYTELSHDGKLSGEQAKNLPSPTTSGAVVGASSSVAPSAAVPAEDGTPSVIASATSPS